MKVYILFINNKIFFFSQKNYFLIPHVAVDFIVMNLIAFVWMGYFISLYIPDTPSTAIKMLNVLASIFIVKICLMLVLTFFYWKLGKMKENIRMKKMNFVLKI